MRGACGNGSTLPRILMTFATAKVGRYLLRQDLGNFVHLKWCSEASPTGGVDDEQRLGLLLQDALNMSSFAKAQAFEPTSPWQAP